MKASRRPIKRPNMRRAVILFPSGFTLGNLFFGIFAIIAASRLEFTTAGVYVMLGGMCDALDGRVARATNSGTEFGEELDSLVDAITFGLAPAMIMYFAVLNRDGWDWIFVFLFSACAVLRLARFNIEQAGTAKTYFQGLPSPAAGITLASYYWFSQSWLYSYGAIGDLPWHKLLRFIMAGLAMLMISNVPYPNFPRTGFRSIKAALASLLLITCAVLFFWLHRLEYFFPLSLIYVAWGLFRWVFFGLFERRQPTIPYDLSEGEDEEDEEMYEVVPTSSVHAERQHRRVEPARPERERARTERPAREPRAPRAEAARTEPGEVDAARAERPVRTEAERAARREKREKRDQKRGKERGERPERAERPARPVAPAGTADVIAPTEPPAPTLETAEPAPDEQLVGSIPGGAEVELPTGSAAPARKRKRRRRRGARDRDAAPGTEGAEGGDSGDEGGFDDDGRDEGPGDDDAGRSPYSASPAPAESAPAARPYTPPLPAPSPAAAPAPAPMTPPPSDSAE